MHLPAPCPCPWPSLPCARQSCQPYPMGEPPPQPCNPPPLAQAAPLPAAPEWALSGMHTIQGSPAQRSPSQPCRTSARASAA